MIMMLKSLGYSWASKGMLELHLRCSVESDHVKIEGSHDQGFEDVRLELCTLPNGNVKMQAELQGPWKER